jgi:hypothetical protein
VGNPGDEEGIRDGHGLLRTGMGRAQNGPISKIRQGGLAFNGIGAIGAVVARFVHTEEVTGSNPVSPTNGSPTMNGPFR